MAESEASWSCQNRSQPVAILATVTLIHHQHSFPRYRTCIDSAGMQMVAFKHSPWGLATCGSLPLGDLPPQLQLMAVPTCSWGHRKRFGIFAQSACRFKICTRQPVPDIHLWEIYNPKQKDAFSACTCKRCSLFIVKSEIQRNLWLACMGVLATKDVYTSTSIQSSDIRVLCLGNVSTKLFCKFLQLVQKLRVNLGGHALSDGCMMRRSTSPSKLLLSWLCISAWPLRSKQRMLWKHPTASQWWPVFGEVLENPAACSQLHNTRDGSRIRWLAEHVQAAELITSHRLRLPAFFVLILLWPPRLPEKLGQSMATHGKAAKRLLLWPKTALLVLADSWQAAYPFLPSLPWPFWLRFYE